MHAQLLAVLCLCILLLSGRAAQHVFEPDGSDETAAFHGRLLQQSAASSVGSGNDSAAAPVTNPTILQTAVATFRLVGNDTMPFTNGTAGLFQQALQNVFSNYSYANFQYASFAVSASYVVAGFQWQAMLQFKPMHHLGCLHSDQGQCTQQAEQSLITKCSGGQLYMCKACMAAVSEALDMIDCFQLHVQVAVVPAGGQWHRGTP